MGSMAVNWKALQDWSEVIMRLTYVLNYLWKGFNLGQKYMVAVLSWRCYFFVVYVPPASGGFYHNWRMWLSEGSANLSVPGTMALSSKAAVDTVPWWIDCPCSWSCPCFCHGTCPTASSCQSFILIRKLDSLRVTYYLGFQGSEETLITSPQCLLPLSIIDGSVRLNRKLL